MFSSVGLVWNSVKFQSFGGTTKLLCQTTELPPYQLGDPVQKRCRHLETRKTGRTSTEWDFQFWETGKIHFSPLRQRISIAKPTKTSHTQRYPSWWVAYQKNGTFARGPCISPFYKASSTHWLFSCRFCRVSSTMLTKESCSSALELTYNRIFLVKRPNWILPTLSWN